MAYSWSPVEELKDQTCTDPITESLFTGTKDIAQLWPVHISVSLGYIEYKVKIYEEVHLEDDPYFPCRKYSSPGQYDQCLEDEYVRQTLDLMACTPPWMTEKQEIWCQDSLNLTQDQAERINYHLGRETWNPLS